MGIQMSSLGTFTRLPLATPISNIPRLLAIASPIVIAPTSCLHDFGTLCHMFQDLVALLDWAAFKHRLGVARMVTWNNTASPWDVTYQPASDDKEI